MNNPADWAKAVDALSAANKVLSDMLANAKLSERLESIEDLLANQFGKNVPGWSDTDLHFDDVIEHTAYLTNPNRFEKEYNASPYVFTSVGCRSDFFHLPLYNWWCEKLKLAPVFLRKQWEWVYITHALYERGMLKPGSRGIGFGVGTEPLVDLYASFGCEILATDLGAEEAEGKGWIETAQHAADKQALAYGLANTEDFNRLVSFRPVNMNAIPDDIRGYDFCYSSCSIEHVGDLSLSKQFVENVLDVLKPGGISIHTTEFVINSDDETVEEGNTVLWRKRDFREVAEKLRAKGHYVEPLDFYTGRHLVDKYVDLPPFGRGEPHLRLLIGKFKCTSFGLIVRKGP